MKNILAFVFLFICVSFLGAQNKTPVISKVTATWCPNCGTWGWDFFEEVKADYEDGDQAVILGVHYSGNLNNSTAQWWASNLKSQGQPVFFLNNEDLNATRNNWNDKVESLKTDIGNINSESVVQNFSFNNAYINDAEEVVANVTFSPAKDVDAEYYFAVYIFENDVLENQSSRGMSMHPNVLRDVMSTENFGDLNIKPGDIPASGNITVEYSKLLNSNWDADNLGLLAVQWRKENGSYIVDNVRSIFNIGLLSSTSQLIDEELVNINTKYNTIEVSVDNNETYNVTLFNTMGQAIQSDLFSNKTILNTEGLASGIYTVHLSQNNNLLSKQVFISN